MVTKYGFKTGKVYSDNGHGPVPLIAGKSSSGQLKVYPGQEPKEGEKFATKEDLMRAASEGTTQPPVIEDITPKEDPKG
jgi:hypothetical protein